MLNSYRWKINFLIYIFYKIRLTAIKWRIEEFRLNKLKK
jgi:hypothetical protein